MEAGLQEVFPRYAYSIVSLRRIVWYLFTRHGNLVNVVVFFTMMVGVAHVLLQNDVVELANEELQLLAYRAIWIIVLCASVLCCYYYVKLIFKFRLRLLYEQCQRCGAVLVLQLMVALFCLGALSIYSLVQQVQLVSSKDESTPITSFWRVTFTATAIAGVLQRLLATVFICIALPVTKRWVCEMKSNVKSMLLELLPWKVFLFLHRNLLSTFFEKPLSSLELYEDSVYIVSIGFRGFCLLWLLFAVLYVGYDFAMPCKYDSQSQGKKELAGVCKIVLNYPPKSQVVTGLSPRHYALRYRGFPSNGEAEREIKARMRTNAMAHEQYRILLSQLD